jgi:CO/xanthine dehydrogenase FAD-binding subunit
MTTVHAPPSPQAAVELLAELAGRGESAAVVGGGTVLVPQLTRLEADPDHLVDLWRAGLGNLAFADPARTVLRVGALVSYQQVLDDPALPDLVPLLPLMCAGITGGVQLRSQGTIGGSACAARPYSDAPSVLAALGAVMRIRSVRGVREVPFTDFVVDAERTVMADDELLEAVDVPVPPPAHRAGHRKVKTAEGSWPIVTVSAVRTARLTHLAVGGVARRPVLVQVTDDQPAAEVGELVAELLGPDAEPEPWTDLLAPSSYRREIAPRLASDLLEQLRAGRHVHPKGHR